jgi:hypothetical protein
MKDEAKNEHILNQQLSSVEENATGERLAALEDEVQQKRQIRQQTNSAYQAMEAKIQQALDALDVSEEMVKNLVAAHVRTMEMTHHQMVEEALLEIQTDSEERNSSHGSVNSSLTDEKVYTF